MTSRLSWNILFLLAWAVAVIAVGSWLSHWLFQASRALAEVAANKQINAPINWLAGYARGVDFPEFQWLGIIVATVIGSLPFLSALLRADGSLRQEMEALSKDHAHLRNAVISTFACAIIAIILGFAFAREMPAWPDSVWLVILRSCLFAFAIELTFRGVFWQIVATRSGPRLAWLISTALYLLFSLSLQPHGIDAWESKLASNRFPLWMSMVQSFLWPAIWTHVVPLFLIATAACYVRQRQPSLWIPIGAQAGFFFSSHLGMHPMVPAIAAVLSIVLCMRDKKPSLPDPS